MTEPYFKERRILPADHPRRARQRILDTLGFGDADFRAARRAYDDPRRTQSKLDLLETVRRSCEAKGKRL